MKADRSKVRRALAGAAPASLFSGVGRLGYGVWQSFGERVNFAEAARIYSTARAGGISHFDAAADYANGLDEEFLGRLIETDPTASQLLAPTKIAPEAAPSGNAHQVATSIHEQTEAALRRLRVDRLGILYSRHVTVPIRSLLPAILAALMGAGKIAAWGVSAWPFPAAVQTPATMLFAEQSLAQHGFASKWGISIAGFAARAGS